MPEPRTHYQVSFTSRQAVLLFVVVLASLAGAYFLGLMTGISGRQPAESAAAAAPVAAPEPTAQPEKAIRGAAVSSPAAASTAPPEGGGGPTAIAAREPTAGGGLQFFEDRAEEPGKTAPAPAAKPPAGAAPSSEGFWVQTLSTTSQKEADARRAALASHGFRAKVFPAATTRGPRLYRVRVGPYPSRDEASRAADTLTSREKVKTWIVPPGD